VVLPENLFLRSDSVCYFASDTTIFPKEAERQTLFGFRLKGKLYVPNPEFKEFYKLFIDGCNNQAPEIFCVTNEAYSLLQLAGNRGLFLRAKGVEHRSDNFFDFEPKNKMVVGFLIENILYVPNSVFIEWFEYFTARCAELKLEHKIFYVSEAAYDSLLLENVNCPADYSEFGEIVLDILKKYRDLVRVPEAVQYVVPSATTDRGFFLKPKHVDFWGNEINSESGNKPCVLTGFWFKGEVYIPNPLFLEWVKYFTARCVFLKLKPVIHHLSLAAYDWLQQDEFNYLTNYSNFDKIVLHFLEGYRSLVGVSEVVQCAEHDAIDRPSLLPKEVVQCAEHDDSPSTGSPAAHRATELEESAVSSLLPKEVVQCAEHDAINRQSLLPKEIQFATALVKRLGLSMASCVLSSLVSSGLLDDSPSTGSPAAHRATELEESAADVQSVGNSFNLFD